MRYADGGGLTAQGRSRREQVRLQAAEMFAKDTDARLPLYRHRCGRSGRLHRNTGGTGYEPDDNSPSNPAAWPLSVSALDGSLTQSS